jgi:hypothetical protein
MADLSLDILVIPTYNTKTLGVADNSTYPTSPAVQSPTMEITIPGFGLVSIPFNTNDFNVYNSSSLELTSVDEDLIAIPDGIYTLTYSVSPAYLNYVTKNIMRVEQIQERFDSAFMKLDMMECDMAIKKQAKVELNTIYFLIQGSIAAANNCAVDVANKLYLQASKQLDKFINNNCGCSGTNYLTNFYNG